MLTSSMSSMSRRESQSGLQSGPAPAAPATAAGHARLERVGASGRRAAAGGAVLDGADDDFHPLLQLIALHFGRRAVTETGADFDRPDELTVADPNRSAAPRVGLLRLRIVRPGGRG